VDRVQQDAVVAPATLARERRHRHDLHRADAEGDEVGQAGDGAAEGALLAEGADVQLIDDAVAEVPAVPCRVGPGERGGVDQPRRPVDAIRLPARPRVWQRRTPVEPERVVIPRVRVRVLEAVPAALVGLQIDRPAARLHLDEGCGRGPHGEAAHEFTTPII
jgi:hypothetical protein